MDIPLVTSIWRGLAGMSDSLPLAWAMAKPLFASGLPERGLARLIERAQLPAPEPLMPMQLAAVGVDGLELARIRTVVEAYNRSNGMNLVALAALVSTHTASQGEAPVPSAPTTWQDFPQLLAQEEIAKNTWNLIREVNAFGTSGVDAHVATLWRHLAHWPGLLALIHAAFAPMRSSGEIADATQRVTDLAQEEGARLVHLRTHTQSLPADALGTITGYVTTPTQVVRMVTLGHILARWLPSTDS